MGFDPRIFPQSFAAFDIKLQSANSVDRYIYAALVDGSFELEKLKGNWLQDIIKQDLYDLYISWCSSNSESPVKNNVFGTTLKKLIPDVEDHRITMQCKRPYIYRFPSLKKARESFCKSFKVNVIDAFGEIDEIE
jgi:phage/plasmid-associated DNA primase